MQWVCDRSSDCYIQTVQWTVSLILTLRRVIDDFQQKFPGTPVSSTNKTDHHDITEIL